MRTICLLDTSVLVEILNIPRKSEEHEIIFSEFQTKIKAGESFFMPLATIIETGNHIAQNGDGNMRRDRAATFRKLLQDFFNQELSFTPMKFPEESDIIEWFKEFPDQAMRGGNNSEKEKGIGIGDISIIHDWEKVKAENKNCRVYVWSKDRHLQLYDHSP